MVMSPRGLWAGAILALALTPAAVVGAEKTPPADPVVATVDGAEIRRADVLAAHQRLPDRMRGLPLETVFPVLVRGLIDSKLAAAEARRRGLDGDPAVKRHVDRFEEQLLERTFLLRIVEDGISEEMLRARYRRKADGTAGREQVRASHILVETEAEARQAITELAAGADFADVARRRSTGPTGAEGGDLGYFAQGEMLPAFSDAAFALKPGETTKDPVRTRYGWHVVKVLDRRTGVMPPFAEAKAGLRAELAREIAGRTIGELRAKADIRRFAADGSPLDGDAAKD